jgi:hypothetical protein
MAIGPSVTTVTVEGAYVDFEGNNIQGQIRFTLGDVLRNGTDDQIVAPSSIVVPLSAGAFSVSLPATNDPDVIPNPFVYTVEESFPGGRSYTISVPFNSVGALNLADISPNPTLATSFVQMVDQTTFNTVKTNIDNLNAGVNTTTDKFLATGKYWYIPSQFATYTALDTAFATYTALTAATYEIDGSDITAFVTSAEAYEVSAEASAISATNSASATINPLLLIGG